MLKATDILLLTSSFVMWSLYEMFMVTFASHFKGFNGSLEISCEGPGLSDKFMNNQIYIIIYCSRIFLISVSWWSFTGVWVTASLLKFPGFFSMFWLNLNNAVVWMVSTRPLISKFSSPFINPSLTIPIGINVTFLFHSFFQFPSKVEVFIFFLLSFNFTLWSARTAKFTILQVLFFCCWLL